MKAYVTHTYGVDAQIELAIVDMVEPAASEVLIEVKATSLNPIDNKLLRNNLGFNPQLPAVLHGDLWEARVDLLLALGGDWKTEKYATNQINSLKSHHTH